MILIGLYYRNYKGGKINYISGYRTSMSMKNQDTWDFAQRLMGSIFFKVGLFLVVPSMLPLFFVIGKDNNTVGNLLGIISVVQIGFLLFPIIIIEKELRKKFDKDGIRKE